MNRVVQDTSKSVLEQQAWPRDTLTSIGDAVITTDSHGAVNFLNPVAQLLTGWSQEEAAGQPLEHVFRAVDEESRQPVDCSAAPALRGDAFTRANDTLLIAKDGTEHPIDCSTSTIRTEWGECTGCVRVFRDTSERRNAEHQVRDALAYAQRIIATLREPFVVLNGDLRVQSVNRAFLETFHVEKEETEGRYLYDLGNGQWNVPFLRTLLAGVLSHAHPIQDFNVEHDFPAIGKRTMLLHASKFESLEGQPNLILLAIEDITERKLAAAAVQGSEVRYRRLFEAAQDAILILDAGTERITDANPYIQRLLGYSHADFVGKELWELGMFRDKEAIRSAFRELQQNGYIRFEHLPLKTKSGEQADVEFVSNLYDVDHRAVIQCNIRDISDRIRLEQESTEQAKALADLHRRKDEFLAMLSHELRNPLAPILNAVQLLRLEEGESALQREARTIIERQVGQMVHLVDDLLEVSRISTGRIHLHREPLILQTIVERGVETARPLISQRRHELVVSLPPSPIWMHGDATRLEQVVVNLLNNAAKYTGNGGQIWVTLTQEGDEAVLRVRDTGEGISPEVLPQVFELFTQAARSLDRSQGGLGIGLSLVQTLVGMHGGRVEACSNLGNGSEFVVHLPVMLTSASPLPVEIAAATQLHVPSLRVLVVEDSVDSANSLAILLRASGHDVRIAYDGLAGLDAAVEFEPNVILLDIGLPGLNGYEVAKQIRQRPALRNVVLVALTGYGQEADRHDSREAGFDHHLVKPANFEKVKQILSTVSNAAN